MGAHGARLPLRAGAVGGHADRPLDRPHRPRPSCRHGRPARSVPPRGVCLRRPCDDRGRPRRPRRPLPPAARRLLRRRFHLRQRLSPMTQATLFTREPVVNRKRAITANRLIAHGADVAAVVESLNALQDVWPSHHPVFVSLERLVPTPDLMAWQAPPNAMVEIPAQAIAHPRTLELLGQLREAGIHTCLAWHTPQTVVPPESEWRFVISDARKNPAPANQPGVPLAWGLADLAAFQTATDRKSTRLNSSHV